VYLVGFIVRTGCEWVERSCKIFCVRWISDTKKHIVLYILLLRIN